MNVYMYNTYNVPTVSIYPQKIRVAELPLKHMQNAEMRRKKRSHHFDKCYERKYVLRCACCEIFFYYGQLDLGNAR
ncbi:hypothetical protein POVWA2_011390 [Plasmodium ovale wallikeri]|uniref:Uncharacterized protein n=1 Tax=Plasmodium ovale wallikeri TaxID=864142 RepID=A0A1A8YN05_PLAOA|nr:hypothetical protein POVWA1_011210 [Plasmodium ovale wallikeri]SBT32760.1 hypothetical protein POVWA2_011390 [Plasmodium ovale wallikeri]